MQKLERITARRSELDTLAEELARQVTEIRAGREELVIAERLLNRPAERTGPLRRPPRPSSRLPPEWRAGRSC